MNERIREFMAEVGISVDYLTNTKQIVLIEKFAELIVRECAEIADTERPSSFGCGYITKTKGMLIQEHFGVAE
jgi:hypothetical protein